MDNRKQEEFVLLFSRHQADISRYIYSLSTNLADTEDILQNCSLALWRKFDDYDKSQPFKNWAFRFAYYEVMKFYEKQKRECQLSDATMSLLSQEFEDGLAVRQAKRQVLSICIQKLNDDEKNLLNLRYEQKLTVRRMNEMFNETGKKIYRALERIRGKLHTCVSHNMRESGWM